MVDIYEITPYETTINTESSIVLWTRITTDNEIWLTQNTEINKVKFKTTTYQTNEDWSQYIDRNDYLSWNYINTLQNEIESSENGYRYSEIQQLDNAITNGAGTATGNDIRTEINLIKGQTTYIVKIIQPIVELTNPPTNTNGIIGIKVADELTAQNIIIRTSTYARITGTMIIAEGSTEIVDIPGLMFQVLTMPFTFISAAFNLTLFPGTPYQINISNLFMAIIAVMAFIFILKLLIGMKGGN